MESKAYIDANVRPTKDTITIKIDTTNYISDVKKIEWALALSSFHCAAFTISNANDIFNQRLKLFNFNVLSFFKRKNRTFPDFKHDNRIVLVSARNTGAFKTLENINGHTVSLFLYRK